jgi:hypothetical protein
MQEQIHFPELNWHILTFLHLIFNMQGHILSTGGDALRTPKTTLVFSWKTFAKMRN